MCHFELTTIQGHGDLLRLSVKGNEYDVFLGQNKDELPKLYEGLFQEAGPFKGVAVNMENIDFMDESGQGLFMWVMQFFRKQQVIASIYGLNKLLKSLFELTRMDRIWGVYPSESLVVQMLEALPFPKSENEANFYSLSKEGKLRESSKLVR